MKKQINLVILLFFLVICWLFYNTAKTSQLALKSLRLNNEHKRSLLQFKKSSLDPADYQITEITLNGTTVPFLYDTRSGACFRLREKNGSLSWESIPYEINQTAR